jgi:hypothetical protein
MNLNSEPTDKQLKRPPLPPFAVGKLVHWYQRNTRYWSRFLTGNEVKIVLFILDQQLGWANVDARRVQKVRISRSVFSGGIVGKQDGMIYQEGVGLADSTIDLILAALEMDQIIRVERTRTRNGYDCWYSLNPLWVPTNSRPSRKQSSPRKSGGGPTINCCAVRHTRARVLVRRGSVPCCMPLQ